MTAGADRSGLGAGVGVVTGGAAISRMAAATRSDQTWGSAERVPSERAATPTRAPARAAAPTRSSIDGRAAARPGAR